MKTKKQLDSSKCVKVNDLENIDSSESECDEPSSFLYNSTIENNFDAEFINKKTSQKNILKKKH